MPIRRGAAALCLVIGTALTGCGSPAASPAPNSAEPAVDLSRLDTGSYPTQPKTIDKPVDLAQAEFLEGQRLANHLALPLEVDPQFAYQLPMGPIRQPDSECLDANTADLITGFENIAYSDADHSVGVTLITDVVIFGSAESATAAAQAPDTLPSPVPHDDSIPYPPPQAVDIPGHPQVLAQLAWDGKLRAATASGRMLVLTCVVDKTLAALDEPTDAAELTTLATENIDAQLTALRGYTPPATDAMLGASPDPDALMSRIMPWPDPHDHAQDIPQLYDGHGGLLATRLPAYTQNLFHDTGTDRIATVDDSAGIRTAYGTQITLFRAKDAAAAQRLRDTNFQMFPGNYTYLPPERNFVPADPPAQLPGARCMKVREDNSSLPSIFVCAVAHGRFAAQVSSNQLGDAQQKAAAQYARLVHSE